MVALASEASRFARLLVRSPRAGLARVSRGLGVARAAYQFRRCDCGELVFAEGPVRVVADGHLTIGARAQFSRGLLQTELICGEGAELMIGQYALVNYGSSFRALSSVRMGARCRVGSMVSVRDHDGDRTAPVRIGDDVWLAHGAAVEPGVTIGDGSVVSTRSVVCDDVPPRSLAIGNPATFIPIDALRRKR